MQNKISQYQQGTVLFVSLIILALITILGVSTLSGGMTELKIAKNNDQMVESVQNADAGVGAAMSLVNTGVDPFNGASVANPFQSFSAADHPLKNLPNVDVSTNYTRAAGVCSRSEDGHSDGKIQCEYYEVVSQDAQANIGITTTVRQGVSREVIGY